MRMMVMKTYFWSLVMMTMMMTMLMMMMTFCSGNW
jgi:hypothetical protein